MLSLLLSYASFVFLKGKGATGGIDLENWQVDIALIPDSKVFGSSLAGGVSVRQL